MYQNKSERIMRSFWILMVLSVTPICANTEATTFIKVRFTEEELERFCTCILDSNMKSCRSDMLPRNSTPNQSYTGRQFYCLWLTVNNSFILDCNTNKSLLNTSESFSNNNRYEFQCNTSCISIVFPDSHKNVVILYDENNTTLINETCAMNYSTTAESLPVSYSTSAESPTDSTSADRETTESQRDSTSADNTLTLIVNQNTILLISLTVVGLIVLTGLIVIVLLWFKRNRSRKNRNIVERKGQPNTPSCDVEESHYEVVAANPAYETRKDVTQEMTDRNTRQINTPRSSDQGFEQDSLSEVIAANPAYLSHKDVKREEDASNQGVSNTFSQKIEYPQPESLDEVVTANPAYVSHKDVKTNPNPVVISKVINGDA